ncbi:MAG: hypothetical protein CK427_13250 [Leptospira sp.]|nr:MAG: hypothetical protein CK427_13250 [Leptospira sp.]
MIPNLEWTEITIGTEEPKVKAPLTSHYTTSSSDQKQKNSLSSSAGAASLMKSNQAMDKEELMQLYHMLMLGKNLDLLGLACRAFSKIHELLPYNKSLLRMAIENKDMLSEVEWKEVWSDVLEKFPTWIAFRLAVKYLPVEWKNDFLDSLFIQNGRISPRMKKENQESNPFEGRIPEWILRNPFGIAKQLLEKTTESKQMIQLLQERLPESYLAHTLLFVDAFLERQEERFYKHYLLAGRMKFHPQALYMKAIMDVRMGKDEEGARMLDLIRHSHPSWEIPLFLQKRGSYASVT